MANISEISENSKSENQKTIPSLTITKNLNPAKYTLEQLLSDRITSESKIKPLEPLVKIGNEESVFCAKGEISLITGQSKSGKTTALSFILGTALMNQIPNELDTLKIKSSWCEGKKILHFDTEQPDFQTQELGNKICKILGSKNTPDNLISINLSKYSNIEKKERIMSFLEHYSKGVYLCVIDGIGDLIHNVNDVYEVNTIFEYFGIKAKELNIGIIFFLHENPNSDKMRGHLGSEAERKCAGTIAFKKDKQKGIFSIHSRLLRYSGDFENIYFKYDKELGRMASLDNAEIKDLAIDKELEKIKELTKLAEKIIVGNIPIDHKIFANRLQSPNYFPHSKPFAEATAKRKIKDMLEFEIVIKDNEGKYKLRKNPNDLVSNVKSE